MGGSYSTTFLFADEDGKQTLIKLKEFMKYGFKNASTNSIGIIEIGSWLVPVGSCPIDYHPVLNLFGDSFIKITTPRRFRKLHFLRIEIVELAFKQYSVHHKILGDCSAVGHSPSRMMFYL